MIRVTVVAEYPFEPKNYEGAAATSQQLAMEVDKKSLEDNLIGLDDVLEWSNVQEVKWEVVDG